MVNPLPTANVEALVSVTEVPTAVVPTVVAVVRPDPEAPYVSTLIAPDGKGCAIATAAQASRSMILYRISYTHSVTSTDDYGDILQMVWELAIEAGAVYRPAAVMLPTSGLSDQVTAVLPVLVTVAEKVWV